MLAAVGAGGLGLAMLGCGKKAQQGTGSSGPRATGTPVQGGTLNVPASANANTLDPHATSVNITTTQVSYVLSRLLRFKTGPDPAVAGNWEMENDLAANVESPDGVTWTVKLAEPFPALPALSVVAAL